MEFKKTDVETMYKCAAMWQGIAVGEAAAAALITARSGDGLEANVTYTWTGRWVWLSVTGRPGVKEYIPVDSPRLVSKLPR